MEIKKEKPNVFIIILLVLICISLCYFAGYEVGKYLNSNEDKQNSSDTKQEDKNENQNNSSNDNKEEENKEVPIQTEIESLDYISLEEALNSKNITFSDILETTNVIWQSNNNQNEFTFNNQTISTIQKENTINFVTNNQTFLTIDYSSNHETGVYVYNIKNHLIITTKGTYIKTIMFDDKLNKILSIFPDDQATPLLADNTIYYGIGECSGKRSDGSIGNIVIIHKFDLNTKSDSVVFNINHDASWMC